jgi:predicted AAA+ superfamily ATPase
VSEEVQHAPDLLLAIKRRVDERRWGGQYVLTGSSDLLVQRNVSESLAGRAGYVPLWPLTRREQLGKARAGMWSELLDLLEVSFQLVRVPGYSANRTRRLIESPKIYWSDTGLGMFLGAEAAPRGAHLENLVVADLLAWAGAAPGRPSVLHWRTVTGAEVDFVIELPDRLLPMEVKASRRVTRRDARHLRTFLQDYPTAPGALLLYDGDEVFRMDRGILASPWHRVI